MKTDKQVFEVDLGNLKSLKSDEVHIDELNLQGGNITKGQQVVDDYTNTDDVREYRLVMVGRKITEKEAEQDSFLREIAMSDNQHSVQQDVFHESGEQFQQAVLRNESGTKHFLRHSYLAFTFLLLVGFSMQLYSESHKFLMVYEDYLDWFIFQHVKRGRSLSNLARMFYFSD